MMLRLTTDAKRSFFLRSRCNWRKPRRDPSAQVGTESIERETRPRPEIIVLSYFQHGSEGVVLPHNHACALRRGRKRIMLMELRPNFKETGVVVMTTNSISPPD